MTSPVDYLAQSEKLGLEIAAVGKRCGCEGSELLLTEW